MSEDREIEYFPEEIEPVRGKDGRLIHIDPTSGMQTFPSFAKRARRRMLVPEDLDKRRREPTQDDEALAHALMQEMHIKGFEMDEGIPTKPIIKAIRELRVGTNTWQAYALLYGIWCAGLVQRSGKIDGRSMRPLHQRWYFEQPTDF